MHLLWIYSKTNIETRNRKVLYGNLLLSVLTILGAVRRVLLLLQMRITACIWSVALILLLLLIWNGILVFLILTLHSVYCVCFSVRLVVLAQCFSVFIYLLACLLTYDLRPRWCPSVQAQVQTQCYLLIFNRQGDWSYTFQLIPICLEAWKIKVA